MRISWELWILTTCLGRVHILLECREMHNVKNKVISSLLGVLQCVKSTL